jgi:hypothetical protein
MSLEGLSSLILVATEAERMPCRIQQHADMLLRLVVGERCSVGARAQELNGSGARPTFVIDLASAGVSPRVR